MCDRCLLAIQTEQWQIRSMDLTTALKQREALCREGSLVKVNVWDGDDTAMKVVIGFVIKKSDDTGKVTGNHWDIKYEAEPNLGYMTRSGQTIACNVRRRRGGAGRYIVRYVHPFWELRDAEQVQTVMVKVKKEDEGDGDNAAADANDEQDNDDERTT